MLFFLYTGLAFGVAVLAVLWGSQKKIFGAAMLLGSIIISNIIFIFFGRLFPNIHDLTLIYVAIDAVLAFCFLNIYRDTSWLSRNRWAGALALIQLAMASVNLAGAFNENYGTSAAHSLALNILMILAIAVCIIGFTPKSMNEAKGLLRMKLLYLKDDLFRRTRISASEAGLPKKRSDQIRLIDEHIGQRLKDLRGKSGLSQAELAEHLGLTQAQINKFESGTNRIGASQLWVLAKFFSVSLDYFSEGLEAAPEAKTFKI